MSHASNLTLRGLEVGWLPSLSLKLAWVALAARLHVKEEHSMWVLKDTKWQFCQSTSKEHWPVSRAKLKILDLSCPWSKSLPDTFPYRKAWVVGSFYLAPGKSSSWAQPLLCLSCSTKESAWLLLAKAWTQKSYILGQPLPRGWVLPEIHGDPLNPRSPQGLDPEGRDSNEYLSLLISASCMQLP